MTYRHKKRGTEYELLGFGKMQAERWVEWSNGETDSVDMREVAVYRSVDDGSMWVRPREEFEDGRFEAVTSPPKAEAGEPVDAIASPSAIKGLKIDREALRRQIERDPDEGEIGVGFELADLDGMERLAMAALPTWARDEILRLRALTSPPKAEAGEAEPFAEFDALDGDERQAWRAGDPRTGAG